ncbi:MAG: DUF4231 domain-containing protein [Pseudomonadota bacterium]|nr:DUF4231 domain-containing protein [Pseudomonadota bacterium]
MSPIETRQARADYYFRTVLDGQREWYSKGAGKQKRRYLAFTICVIVLGALISLLRVLDKADWERHFTAALGAGVSISRAVDTLLRPSETWQAYRKASEGMKREYRLYLNNADAYAAAEDEASVYRLLVERVETIIAEEQQLFWQSQAKAGTEQATGGQNKPRVGPSRNHRNRLSKAHERHLQRLPIEMTAIFISHSSKDNAWAQRLKTWLEDKQHRSLFLDFDRETGLKAG